jgi:hypothetical protein
MRFAFKRLGFVLVLVGGTILQFSCGDIVGGLSASIANEYVRSVISDWMNISTGFSLTGL